MDHEVHHPVAVAKFIVVPGNELDEVVVEGNASPSIKSGRVSVTVEVTGHNLVLSVAQDALEGALGRLLHHLLDVIIFCRFLQAAGQIHNRHVGGGDTEGHASELPVELRDDLAHSLGSAGRSRDDVLGSPSAITPQLPRRAIHSLLGGSDGMDRGHESLHDAEVVMDDLGQGCQAVGGAGGIADDLEGVVILLMVHAHHKHGGIGRRGRDDDPLGPTLQVSPGLLHGREDTSGLHNIRSTSITPFDVGGISLLEDGDGLSIDDKLPVLRLDCAVELAVGGIILEHVDHVVEVNEGVIDGDNVHFARVKSSPGDQAPDAAKSVHSDLHHRVSGTRLAMHGTHGCLSNGEGDNRSSKDPELRDEREKSNYNLSFIILLKDFQETIQTRDCKIHSPHSRNKVC